MKKTVRKGKRWLGLLLALSLMVSLLTAPAGAIVTGMPSALDQGNNVVLDNENSDPAVSNGDSDSAGNNGDSDPAGNSGGSDPAGSNGNSNPAVSNGDSDPADSSGDSDPDGSGDDGGEPQQPVFQWSLESRLNRDYLAAGDTAEGALGFTLIASPDADNTLAADTLTVSASLTLPKGLDLPQGKYTWDGSNLSCDNVPVAELTAAGASVTADYNDETGVFTVVLAWTDVDAAQSSTLSFGQDVLDWTDYTLEDSHQVKLEAGLEAQAQGGESVQAQAPEALADLVEAAGTVTVLERQDVSCPVRYLDKNGQAAPRLEAQPQFTLFCSVDGAEPVELTAELAAQLGMAELPQLQITNDANSWTADITELPSRISVSDGQGGAVEQTIAWSIQVSGDADKYDLKNLSADEAKQYPGASGAGWYYIFNEDTVDYVEGDTVSVEYIKDDIIHDVYWRDNNDEDKIRPTDASPLYELQFAWDGSSVYQPVTEQDLAALGLTSLPTAVLTNQGNNHFQLVVDKNTLPSKVTYTDGSGKDETHTVAWRMVIQDVTGYTRVEVAEDEQGEFAGYDAGTYYILQEDFNITVQLRRGNTTMGAGITQAFQNEFALKVIYGQGNEDEILLSSLEGTAVKVEFEAPDADHPNTAYITIRNVWRYYMDGSRVVYSVQKADGQTRLDLDSLPEGDYFSISYDNSAVPNYGTQVDRVYSGGTLNFSLAGTTTYDAQKVWLDNEDNVRPEAELQLWRYRSDKSYTTAAPVRDAQGDIITLPLDGSDVQTIQFSADLDGDGTEENVLPKYDPEGYEYIYVSKEFLSGIDDADSYEQVFGVVEADGSVTDTVPYFDPDTNGVIYVQDDSRETGNDFLYQGGTLSNRVTGNIVLSGTKQWKAAVFQAEFENVTVELMAQYRSAGSQEGWQDTEYRVTMEDFYAENLSITQSMALPLYDELGQRLEYRWVEARVTQDGEPVPAFSHPDGSITFTLEQAGRQVIYRSESILQSDDSTLVVNTIANTIRYDVTKVWRDENGADISQDKVGTETEFALYRATSGNDMTEYLTFTMDGVADQQATQIQVSDGASVTCQETASWQAEILGLPEFDENGSQYEYMIVEAGGQWMPNIQTDRDLEGYHSIVTNIPGEGYRILVRKEWVDDSDVQHRQPVTVGVYTRDTNTLIATTTLEEGQWFAYVGLGSDGQGHYYTPDEVYVLETQVGDTELSLQDYTIGQGEPSSQPAAPEEYSTDGVVNTSGDWTRIQYRTDYHLYEATYSSGTIGPDEVYFITNRRLGQVDLTVEKTWITGDTGRDALRQALEEAGIDLALKLEFQSEQKANYEITSSGFGDAQA